MAETNEQRKKRRVRPNTPQEVLDAPVLPPSVVPTIRQTPPSTAPAIQPSVSQGLQARQEGIVPSFGRGIESGVETVESLKQGAVGAIAGSLGFEEEGRERLALAQHAQAGSQINAPRIERVQDVTNIQDAAEFVAGIAGKQGIIMAPIIGAGLAAAAASPLLPVSAGAAATIGAVGAGIGLETGDAFTNIAGDEQSVENLGFQGASLASLASGTVAGSLEAVPALSAIKRTGLLGPLKRAVRGRLLERVGKGALSQSGIEGLTEGAQTIVQRTAANFANENREILGEEGYDELINAIATGAIFGTIVGAGTGVVPGGRNPTPGSIEDQVDLEEQLDALDDAGGFSTDIEAEIDRLGEAGQDIRDSRLLPSLRHINGNPEEVIIDMTRASLEEGGLKSFRSADRLYAAIRALEDPELELPGLLTAAGIEIDEVDSVMNGLIDRAISKEEEFLQDLATAPAQGQVVTETEAEGLSEQGTSGDDPGAKQFSVDEGFQNLHSTRNFIFRTSNGTLGFVPPQREGQENSLVTMVNNLERDYPDIIFDTVPLGDAIVEDLDKEIRNNETELEQILNDVALQKLVEPKLNHERFGEVDPANPREYLNQFQAVRRTQVNTDVSGADEFRLTDFDVFGGPLKGTVTPGKKVFTGEQVQAEQLAELTDRREKDLALVTDPNTAPNVKALLQQRLERLETRIEQTAGANQLPPSEKRATASVRQPRQKPLVKIKKVADEADMPVLVPTVQKMKDEKGNFILDDDGVPLTEVVDVAQKLDAVKLTNLMLTKLRHKGPRTTDVAANAFFNGLAAISSHGIKLDTTQILSDTVVSKKSGKDITYEEITSKGSGRIRARINNFKKEEKRLVERIADLGRKISNTTDKNKQRKMRFLVKKAKRRIKKIPDDIAVMKLFGKSTASDVRSLLEDLKSTKELLAAEEADLDNFSELAHEINIMAEFLKADGTESLAAEQLAAASEEMQKIVEAADDEAGRIRQDTAQPGSRNAFFQESGAELDTAGVTDLREIGARKRREALTKINPGRAGERLTAEGTLVDEAGNSLVPPPVEVAEPAELQPDAPQDPDRIERVTTKKASTTTGDVHFLAGAPSAADIKHYRDRLEKSMRYSVNTDGPRSVGKGDTLLEDEFLEELQDNFSEWTEMLKMKTKIILGRKAVEHHLKVTRGDPEALEAWEQFVSGESDGIYDFLNDTVLLNPFLRDMDGLLETMAHELGHAIFKKWLVKKHGATFELTEFNATPEVAAIMKEWRQWRKDNNHPDIDADTIAGTKQPFFTAMDRILYGDMKPLSELTPEMQNYVLSFEEWFADQVARFLTSDRIGTKEKQLSTVEKAFKGIAEDVIALFRSLVELAGFKPAESVNDFLDNIIHSEEEVSTLSENFKTLLETADLPADTPAVAGVMQSLDPFGKSTPWMLRSAFNQVLNEEERRTLFKFFSRASQKRRLKELAGTDAQKTLIENNPLHAAVFGYQMWMAGEFTIGSQSRRILQDQAGISQEDVAGPVSQFVLDLFTVIFDKLSSIFGIIHADQQSEQILEAIRDGYIDQRKAGQIRWAVNKQLKGTLLRRVGATFNTAFEHVKPFYERALVVADQRLLDSGIPGLIKIARGYHAAVGQEEQGETFFEARTAKIGLFMTSYTRLTAELRADPALKEDVLAAMRNPDKKANKDKDVQRIAAAIFKFNRRFKNYLEAAGVKIGDRGPRYFPWVWDQRKLQDNMDFIDGLLRDKRFEGEMNKWLENRNKEITLQNTANAAQGGEAKFDIQPLMTMDELIADIEAALTQNEGYVDTELNPNQTGTTPWFAGMHHRALHFLTKEEGGLTETEREKFDSLFSDQMDLTMMTYIRQGVKRAEYSRRFGARSQRLQQMLQEARAEGASKEQMRAAYMYIDAMNGVLGDDTNQRISKLLKLGARKGEVINPHWRTFTSVMMVIQNMAVLPLATLTSLVDPVGIAVRSQDMTATMASLRAGATEIAAEIKIIAGNDEEIQRSELRKLAEGIGTIEDHLTNEALEWEYGSTYLTPRLKAANEFFFKAIGLTQWTRVTRIMALAGGKEFIKRHVQRPVAENGVDGARSARFLRQLGIAAEDVRFDKEGDLLILSRMQRETDGVLTAAELARDDRVRNALNRFVNESILRPNAAQRPIWASDPNYALIFHLKSFMFSFHDRILRRVFQEAALGNVAPLVILTAFVPAMLFADILRDMIRFGLGGNPRKASWGLEDHIWNATQRSGVNGIGQLLIDAKSDIQFGGFGYESMAGPTVDGITDLDGLFASDNEEQWRAFGRNLPGNAAWKHWIGNGIDES